MDISKIDKNFIVDSKIDREGLEFYDIDESPFKIHGVFREGECYRRMPESAAKNVSSGILALHSHTAGGRVRFVTDSPYIAIYVKLNNINKMSHFAFTGSIGSDLYSGKRYFGTFVPPTNVTNEYQNIVDIYDVAQREYTINMPLYSGVNKMYIGIKQGCVLKTAPDYKITKPVVYYGSSVTQGGCASRPGNAYQSIISRELDCDFINLGFSGSARAEDAIANYIAGLDMSAFVYDYDYNSNLTHYIKTHERMFKIIRQSNPNTPIIMMTRPKYYLSQNYQDETKRLDVLLNTYNNAIASGDKNVYYINGQDLLIDLLRESALVDNCHPTDCGFASMAYVIGNKLKEIL